MLENVNVCKPYLIATSSYKKSLVILNTYNYYLQENVIAIMYC